MTYTPILRRITALLTIIVFFAFPAASQGFKWWQSEEYKRELQLTAEQVKRLEHIFQSSVPTLKTQKKLLDSEEAKFEQLIERGGDAAIMEQLNHVEMARAELNKSRYWMLLQMRKVLTADQWPKLTALQQRAAQKSTTPARER